MEGYDNEFVPVPESRYECPICFLVLREPHQTKCGHIFCKFCILKSLRDSSSRCPMDNEPLTEADIYPDNFAKREILNFNIRCTNNVDGCDKIFPLGTLQNHLEECPFVLVPCPNKCACIMQRSLIHDHITCSCENRLVTCGHCPKSMEAKVMKNHVLACPKTIVACPHCKEKKARSEVEQHIKNDCQQVEVHCPFFHLGCTSSMMRSLLEEHLMLAGSSHLKQICHAVTILAQKMGIVHLISKTPPKNLYENPRLSHSVSLESVVDSQDPSQNKSYLADISSIGGLARNFETTLAQLQALNLEQDRRQGENNAISGTRYRPFVNSDAEQHRLTESHYPDSCPVSKSELENISNSCISKNHKDNFPARRPMHNSHPLSIASTSQNCDSDIPSFFTNDIFNGASSNTNSDLLHIIEEITCRFRHREVALQRKFEDLHNRFRVVEQENSDLVKVVQNLEQQVIETSAKFYNGDFCWSISNFSQYLLKLEAGENSMLHSPPFYTCPWGYKMCIRANIDKSSGNDQLSLFIHLMKSKNDEFLIWPFSGKITMCVVDQNPDVKKRVHLKETLEANPNLAAFQKPTTSRNHKGFGYIGFLSIADLENSTLLMDDTLVIRIRVFPPSSR